MRRLYILIIATFAILICLGFNSSRAIVWENDNGAYAFRSDNLLRLHILANSSSPEDQYLKRQIRDLIIDEAHGLFTNVNDLNQAVEVTNTNLPTLKHRIEEYLFSQGKKLEVKMDIGNFEFPTRTYGNVTLPAGDYRALRVTLGEGDGNNWWCVLFPPLCLDQEEKITKNDKKQLSSIFLANEPEEIKVEYRFKILETLGEIPKWVRACAESKYFSTLKIGYFDLD